MDAQPHTIRAVGLASPNLPSRLHVQKSTSDGEGDQDGSRPDQSKGLLQHAGPVFQVAPFLCPFSAAFIPLDS